MTTPFRFLAALAVAVVALLPFTAPATASAAAVDECVALDLADTVAVAARSAMVEDVFVGRIAGTDGGASEATGETPRRQTLHHIVVEVPLKGTAPMGEVVKVVLTSSGRTGAGLKRGERYVMFTNGKTSPLQADACDGYTSAEGLDTARIETLRDDLNPEPEAPEVVISKPEDGAGDSPDLGRVVAPGGAISLIGVLGLVLVSRVGRQRH